MYLNQKIAVMRSADTVEELTLEDAYREFMTNTTTPGVYEMIDKAVSCGALKDDLPDKASAIEYMIRWMPAEYLIYDIEQYGGIITVYNYLAAGMSEEEYETKVKGRIAPLTRMPGTYKGSLFIDIYYLKQYLIWRETGEFTEDCGFLREDALRWQKEARMDALIRRKKG